MKIEEYAKKLLLGTDLKSKLLPHDLIDWDKTLDYPSQRFNEPGRDQKISFDERQVKFPGKGALVHEKERGKALHFFANHELLAIEMMAQALLLFPEMTSVQKKVLISTISDEQKHFTLYVNKMEKYGVQFGDYPLNRFFWSFMKKITTSDEFFAVISLTFEQANLDFAKYYQGVFEEVGDEETSEILRIVYEDEIRHVARGKYELSQKVKEAQEELWDYYCALLPDSLTPSRAKGIIFDSMGRAKAGLPPRYIKTLKDYQNDFSITKRKQWKN